MLKHYDVSKLIYQTHFVILLHNCPQYKALAHVSTLSGLYKIQKMPAKNKRTFMMTWCELWRPINWIMTHFCSKYLFSWPKKLFPLT